MTFTASLGTPGSGPGLLQLGGAGMAPISFARSIPTAAVPFLAHLYDNSGVAPNTTTATFPVLVRNPLKATLANGSYDAITLEVANPVAGIALGDVVRLTEQRSPYGGYVYSGTVESLPDTVSPTGTKHEIVLQPYGAELDNCYSTSVYSTPTDAAVVFRDAIAQTQHCFTDDVACPALTGALIAQDGTVDFSNQTVKQQIDTARTFAGPTWFWFVDEIGRAWFQSQGSVAVYTVPMAAYEQRVQTTDIQSRKNDILVVGQVPTGGSAPVTSRYTGTSQSTIGKRSLSPPVSVNVADQATADLIAATLGGVLDITWAKLTADILAPQFTSRIHGSQPGGAMLRTWEPAVFPMPESETGPGGYTGPYIVQTLTYDGLRQVVEAGNQPVTSQTDLQNMVQNLVHLAAANQAANPSVPLTTSSTMTGSLAVSSGPLISTGGLASAQVASDAFGLIQASPGQTIAGTGATSWSLTTPAITHTFTMEQRALAAIYVQAIARTSGGLSYVRLNLLQNVDSVLGTVQTSVATSRVIMFANLTLVTGAGWLIGTFGPGSFTAQIEVAADAGQSITFDNGGFQALAFGDW